MVGKQMSLDAAISAAENVVTTVREMHKRIGQLEAQIKRAQTRLEHYRSLTLVQGKEITRLKKGLKP